MASIIESESPSNTKEKKTSHKKKEKEKGEGETKEIYFIILYQRKQQDKPDDFSFLENAINPQNIYSDEIKQENGGYFYKKVFKFIGKTDNKYSLDFYSVQN